MKIFLSSSITRNNTHCIPTIRKKHKQSFETFMLLVKFLRLLSIFKSKKVKKNETDNKVRAVILFLYDRLLSIFKSNKVKKEMKLVVK